MNIAAVVLAAGQSRRMDGPNKLTETIRGRPLVRIAVEAALSSRAGRVVVVTGHQADAVESALAGLPVAIVRNPDYPAGMSSSLRAGIAGLPAGADGAVVVLADMPDVDGPTIDRLIDAFDPQGGVHVVVAAHNGRRGNPVLWSRRFFADLMQVTGDIGGRDLMAAHADVVRTVELGPQVGRDVDTPEAMEAARLNR